MRLGRVSLNPFEFRAGLKLAARGAAQAAPGLNPFEFRAGLKLLVGEGSR